MKKRISFIIDFVHLILGILLILVVYATLLPFIWFIH